MEPKSPDPKYSTMPTVTNIQRLSEFILKVSDLCHLVNQSIPNWEETREVRILHAVVQSLARDSDEISVLVSQMGGAPRIDVETWDTTRRECQHDFINFPEAGRAVCRHCLTVTDQIYGAKTVGPWPTGPLDVDPT